MASPEGHGPSPADLPAAEGVEALTGHETTAGVADAAAHGEGGGLPQLQFEYWGGQIVWLLVTFAILYFLIARVFAPRLRGALDAREQTITGALADARRVQTEAASQTAAAQAELAAARASAQRTAADAKTRAQAEAAARQAQEEAKLNQHLVQAEGRIRQSRDDAMANVRTIAVDTAQAITEKLTGRPAAAGEIEAALSQVSTRSAA